MSQKELDLARQAKEALKNPALTEAFLRYEAKIVDELRRTADRNLQETLVRHLRSLGVVRKNLEVMVADGVEAQKKLDWELTLAERATARLRKVING